MLSDSHKIKIMGEAVLMLLLDFEQRIVGIDEPANVDEKILLCIAGEGKGVQ